jgi:uncharacterized membrane protein YadS
MLEKQNANSRSKNLRKAELIVLGAIVAWLIIAFILIAFFNKFMFLPAQTWHSQQLTDLFDGFCLSMPLFILALATIKIAQIFDKNGGLRL